MCKRSSASLEVPRLHDRRTTSSPTHRLGQRASGTSLTVRRRYVSVILSRFRLKNKVIKAKMSNNNNNNKNNNTRRKFSTIDWIPRGTASATPSTTRCQFFVPGTDKKEESESRTAYPPVTQTQLQINISMSIHNEHLCRIHTLGDS